jgi:hypothetical protein
LQDRLFSSSDLQNLSNVHWLQLLLQHKSEFIARPTQYYLTLKLKSLTMAFEYQGNRGGLNLHAVGCPRLSFLLA